MGGGSLGYNSPQHSLSTLPINPLATLPITSSPYWSALSTQHPVSTQLHVYPLTYTPSMCLPSCILLVCIPPHLYPSLCLPSCILLVCIPPHLYPSLYPPYCIPLPISCTPSHLSLFLILYPLPHLVPPSSQCPPGRWIGQPWRPSRNSGPW